MSEVDSSTGKKLCAFPDCDRPFRSMGVCNTHYEQQRLRGGMWSIGDESRYIQKGLTCTFEGCENPVAGRGLCKAHWYQDRHGTAGELKPIGYRQTQKGKTCSFDGCDNKAVAKSYCSGHYQQWRKYGRVYTFVKPREQYHYQGYLKVLSRGHHRADRDGFVYEHILVMEKIVGRLILPKETIHHKNGVKDDNRPKNLELWSSRHPKGQRVADKIRFAHEIIELYGSEPSLYE